MIYKYLLITFMTGFFSIQALSAEWTNNRDIKIIFESVTDGKYYYPLIKYLAELNFNNSYDPTILNLKMKILEG